jgi:hypothetical protein
MGRMLHDWDIEVKTISCRLRKSRLLIRIKIPRDSVYVDTKT